MTTPAPRPGILDLKPYVGGLHSVEGVDEVIVLASNETPLGPSPRAVEAYKATAAELHRYSDGHATALREKIAERFGVDADRVVCGAGSDELLQLLIRAYAGPGDEVLYSRHGFSIYPIFTRGAGATPVPAPEKVLTADVDSLLGRVTDKTRILFLANPNNPTGSYIPADELQRLRDGLRDDILLVIDSAYAEYVNRNDYTAGIEMVERHDNVVMTRTFSKIYGLAALRLGWAYCPDAIADVLHRLRGPFNVNAAAQAAGIAALEDTEHTDRARAHNDTWLPWTTTTLGALGLTVHPSVGNFVLVQFADAAAATTAYEFLLSRGIITRKMDSYELPDCLRITIGLESEMKALAGALSDHMSGA
ncbi:MAG: histidinol-phosphate transaminase [Alphaproteobacteria bacterium]|nr:histidinol-phosphate transaminase [Alphaproteobacteria bacterium]